MRVKHEVLCRASYVLAEAADCPVRSGNDGGAGCGSIGRLVCPEQIAAALFTVAEIHGGYRNDLAAMGIGK